MATTELVKIAEFQILIQIRGGQLWNSLILFTIRHLGFLGGQLWRVTLYVLRAAFCNLPMFFLLQLIFSGIYFPSESLFDTFPLQEKSRLQVRGEYWAVEVRFNKC